MQISSCLVTVPSTCRLLPPTAAAPSKASVVDAAAADAAAAANSTSVSASHEQKKVMGRRDLAVKTINILAAAGTPGLLLLSPLAMAASDEEYVKETSDAIRMVRTAITMDKTDPNVASAVAELREASNSWVAKYRREKSLLGRASFRDMYSALNAVSGHYVSFGPTAPIPAKRKARILEEVDTAEKALLRGR